MVRFTIQLESFDLDEFLVAFVVPGIVSKEPRCMHVKTPGSPIRDAENESDKEEVQMDKERVRRIRLAWKKSGSTKRKQETEIGDSDAVEDSEISSRKRIRRCRLPGLEGKGIKSIFVDKEDNWDEVEQGSR